MDREIDVVEGKRRATEAVLSLPQPPQGVYVVCTQHDLFIEPVAKIKHNSDPGYLSRPAGWFAPFAGETTHEYMIEKLRRACSTDLCSSCDRFHCVT